jgi:ornithine carbamoyltransferase
VGDGNNVAHSLLLTGAKLGARITVVTPPGFEPKPEVVAWARAACRETGGTAIVTTSIEEGVSAARAVYTDVWASMGQEEEAEARKKTFEPYRVTRRVFDLAAPDAVFLHCLPAHRGEEVEASVIDSPASAVLDQAENRLHAQKALLVRLMGASSCSGRSARGALGDEGAGVSLEWRRRSRASCCCAWFSLLSCLHVAHPRSRLLPNARRPR